MKTKTAIISPISRVIINGESARSLDVLSLKKYLEDKGEDVYYVSKKIKETDDKYLNILTLDSLNMFDNIYIHNFNTNFFGGVVPSETIFTLRLLSKYNGNIYYYITDPNLKYENIAKSILSRKNLKQTIDKEEMKNIEKSLAFLQLRMNVAFTGYRYEPIYGLDDTCRVVYLDTFRIAASIIKQKTNNISRDKLYDICYYGDNRGSYRNNKVKKFFGTTNISTLTIGHDVGGISKNTHLEKVKHSELSSLVSSCYANLVVGDKEHENAFATFRFYEGIAFNVVNFIDYEYDKNKILFKSQKLKEFNYITSQYDLVNKIIELKNDAELYKEIVELQKIEYNL